jgi:hypothetical protein
MPVKIHEFSIFWGFLEVTDVIRICVIFALKPFLSSGMRFIFIIGGDHIFFGFQSLPLASTGTGKCFFHLFSRFANASGTFIAGIGCATNTITIRRVLTLCSDTVTSTTDVSLT